jgi:hypothetical protein
VAELKAEGKALHHCVGTYAERVANGSTNIFFIRKAEQPDTPYYTLEIGQNGSIVQCRGNKNHNAEGDVLWCAQNFQRALQLPA